MFLAYKPERRYLEPQPCGNCGELLYPGHSVAVSWGRDKSEIILFHAESAACIPAGNTYDGYWSKEGEIRFHSAVEKC